MTADPLRIWCNFPFHEPAATLLRAGVADEELVHLDEPPTGPRNPDAPGPAPQDADILFGQPDPASLIAGSRVRWIQLTSAGYARYDRDDVRQALRTRGALLTNSSSVFDEPCAQHLAAMLLALARGLPQCVDNQREGRAWLQHERAGRTARLLEGELALIYGFGAIARRLVELLSPLRMRLAGVRRNPRGDEAVPLLTPNEADDRLPQADHVVNILPESDSTRGYFGSERFARFKRGARFYNIGRGATVDQDALLVALRESRIESAYLDVTDPEPLPPDHPLWQVPNCWITPHLAGAHVDEEERLVRHFLRNLHSFKSNEELRNRVI